MTIMQADSDVGGGIEHFPAQILKLCIHIRFKMPCKKLPIVLVAGEGLPLLFRWWVVRKQGNESITSPFPLSFLGFAYSVPSWSPLSIPGEVILCGISGKKVICVNKETLTRCLL